MALNVTLLCVGLDLLICEGVFKLVLVIEFFQMKSQAELSLVSDMDQI